MQRCTSGIRAAIASALLVVLLSLGVSDARAASLRVGDIVVSDMTTKSIIRVDPASGEQDLISSGGSLVTPSAISIGPGGEVLVADTGVDGTGAIVSVDPSTGAQTTLASGGFFDHPVGITLDRDGTALVTMFDGGEIIRVNLSSGAQSVVAQGLTFPAYGVTDGSGQIFVGRGPQTNAVIRVDTAGGAQSVLSEGGYLPSTSLSALALDSNGNVVMFVEGGGGSVIRIDRVSGQQSLISSGGFLSFDLEGIAVDNAGNILVTVPGDHALIQIDPLSGRQTLVSLGGSLVEPFSVAVVPAPEPCDAALLATGALSVMLARRVKLLLAR